jgi:hypothetical protein
MEDGLRVEIERLHKMLDAVHARVYEQGLIIEHQKQEIESLKVVYNDHEIKLNHVLATPSPTRDTNQTPSYKEDLKTGLPELTNNIIKEQSDRQRRSKNIIIKDKRNPNESLIKPSTDPTKAVQTWLTSHGLTQKEITNSCVRVIPNKPIPASDPTPQHGGHTIIITLPGVDNRFTAIGKIKRSIRENTNTNLVFVDADLTPTEASEQYNLRLQRNQLNAERLDKSSHHFGIRNGKVIKITH